VLRSKRIQGSFQVCLFVLQSSNFGCLRLHDLLKIVLWARHLGAAAFETWMYCKSRETWR
jgi:hypothetical protein